MREKEHNFVSTLVSSPGNIDLLNILIQMVPNIRINHVSNMFYLYKRMNVYIEKMNNITLLNLLLSISPFTVSISNYALNGSSYGSLKQLVLSKQ